jgi:hypothetical protein
LESIAQGRDELSIRSTCRRDVAQPFAAVAGHDTRAHKNIQHTVRYTELAPDRFKDFWR